VTVYDRQTHALVRNMPRASRASNSADVQKNADGLIDVYFGPKAAARRTALPVAVNDNDLVLLRRIQRAGSPPGRSSARSA
jgi:hypothetical protein